MKRKRCLLGRTSLLTLLLAVFSFALPGLNGHDLRVVAFHAVVPVSGKAPAIDGMLDEPCWRKAAAATRYYEYFKSDPDPSELKSEFKMLYDEKGLYLGIINHEEHPDKIRAGITKNDSDDLWKDDCAEIYIDPEGKGVGFLKFVVNSIGTMADMKRIDASVSLPGWNGAGWRAATSVNSDSWVIEAFFPWSDLGGKADVGDVWMFDHVRYAYTTGGFRGATWSPGGNYTAPENFGYIYFMDETEGVVETRRLGDLLSSRVSPPWLLPLRRGFLFRVPGKTPAFLTFGEFIEREREAAEAEFEKTEKLLKALNGDAVSEAELKKLKEEYNRLFKAFEGVRDAAVPDPVAALKSSKDLGRLRNGADALFWKIKLLVFLMEKDDALKGEKGNETKN